jgi:hypothetical protein
MRKPFASHGMRRLPLIIIVTGLCTVVKLNIGVPRRLLLRQNFNIIADISNNLLIKMLSQSFFAQILRKLLTNFMFNKRKFFLCLASYIFCFVPKRHAFSYRIAIAFT